ncbi:MAG: thioredoxin [Ruminococcus sp.]|nr:thioredoxin [Ruminococcus sp.]
MAVIEVTKDTFEQEVLNSDKPVLVDYNADWCGPCRMMRPVLDELAAERDDIKVVSINIDDEDELAEDNDISSIPCLVVYKNGKEAARNVGLVPKDVVIDLIGG